MGKKIFSMVVLGILFSLGIYTVFFSTQEDISYLENRDLTVTEDLKGTSFFNNTFQSKFENLVMDQFPDRYMMVKEKNQVDYFSSSMFYHFLKNPLLLNPIGSGIINQIGNSHMLMTSPIEYNPDWEDRILRRIEQINTLQKDYPEVEMYVYKPTQIHEMSFFDEANGIDSAGDIYAPLWEQLETKHTAFNIESIEDYPKYFYTTDHHWNHAGSYLGYTQIMEMMGLENQIIKPKEEICFDFGFYGTYSTQSGFVTPPSDFCVYTYDLKDYKMYNLDGEMEIENMNTFVEKTDVDPMNYHYNQAYKVGDGYTKVINETASEGNLLIIGDSYAGPIIPLLANTFKEVTLIYPINYSALTKEEFNYDTYIKENDIDKVLFMYTIENYYLSDEWGERYLAFDVVREEE